MNIDHTLHPGPVSDATAGGDVKWDTGSHEGFFRYYEQQSLSPQTMARFRVTTETLLRLFASVGRQGPFDVLDIGCGAGAQGRFWLERGHRYWGLDINEPLLHLAQQRALQQGLAAEFKVGSATELPFATESVDVCLLPFILEHVVDWPLCIDEALRVLRPGGLIFVSTTSKLCPLQDEFDLPMYAWYPSVLKRHYERLAVTNRPELVNHAKYPAVNWFSVYGLSRFLSDRGCDTFDRFDLLDASSKGRLGTAALATIRSLGLARWLGHLLTPYTLVVGRKQA